MSESIDPPNSKTWEHRAEVYAAIGGLLCVATGIGPLEMYAGASRFLLIAAVTSFGISTYCAWRMYRSKKAERTSAAP